MIKFTANSNDSGQRLDKLIQKVMPDIPKSLMYKGIRKNNVRVNGKHCHDEKYIIQNGDEIMLFFSDEFLKNKMDLIKLPLPDVVYEDSNIIIVNKPAGIPVHADDKNSKDTLIARILYYLETTKCYNPLSENSFTPALCNRLDRNTEGLVIAAKNAEALRIINNKIKNKEIKKFYYAKADGIFNKKEDVLISYLERNEKRVTVNNTGTGKSIETKYKVISEKDDTSMLEIELLTGRTHQIRAQLSYIGHPLSGDIKYGGKKTNNGYKLVSYKLLFAFKTDAGILNYLNNKEFKLKDCQDF